MTQTEENLLSEADRAVEQTLVFVSKIKKKSNADLGFTAKAIDTAVTAAKANRFVLFKLWHSAAKVVDEPLLVRILTFSLAKIVPAQIELFEFLALAMLSSPLVGKDTSSQINLLTSISRWDQSEAGIPETLMLQLPKFLLCALESASLVSEATVELIDQLSAGPLLDRLPRLTIEALRAKLSQAVEKHVEDAQRAAEELQRVKGQPDLQFHRRMTRALERLKDDVADKIEARASEDLKDAARLLDGLHFEALARYRSMELKIPVQTIRIVSSKESSPSYDLVSSALRLWFAVFRSAFETEPKLRPLESGRGSYILNTGIDTKADPSTAFNALRDVTTASSEELQRQLEHGSFSKESFKDLLEVLVYYRAEIEVSMINGAEETCEHISISLKNARNILNAAREAASLPQLESHAIPQADEIQRVFTLIEIIRAGESVTPESLGVTLRQVNYYKQAARILRLLTDENLITSAGIQVAKLKDSEKLMFSAVLFEESDCGSRWIEWSKGTTLADVEAESALQFIRESVPALSLVTAKRRAQTLTRWCNDLKPFHYTNWTPGETPN